MQCCQPLPNLIIGVPHAHLWCVYRCLQLQAAAPRPTTEQLVLDHLPTTTDLGLDCQKPWNEKFHVKPEAYVAEGWLPEAPTSYLEALKRQQRLLHGVERRQSLRLHKVCSGH